MRGLPNFTHDYLPFGHGVVYGPKSSKAPPPPDPKVTGAAQTQSNVNTAVANAILANTNQQTPTGSLTYTKTGETQLPDGNGGFVNVPSYNAATALSPQQQQIFDAEQRATLGMTNLAGDYTSRIADATAKPFSYEGMPEAPVYDEAFRQKQLGAIMQRAQPAQDRDREMLAQTLANQGINLGSKPWENAQRDFATGQNDFRLGADIQAGQEAQRIFGLQGTTRDRAISEALQQRNQPINEVAALLGTGPGVQQPNFVNTPQSNVEGTDWAGIYNQDYQNRMAAYQMKQQQKGAVMGGLFGLAGSVAGGFARSDRRVKRDIQRVGTYHNGLPIWQYSFIDDDSNTLHFGFMADEVRELHPHAVMNIGGVDYVKYSEAVK